MALDNYENFKAEYLRMSKIDLNLYKEKQMKRRIDSFISKCDVRGYSDFLKLIARDTDLYDKFITHLTINVSEFYRNPTQWKSLENEVLPSLIRKFGKNLKIWSAACSTGDEPYTLAMVLGEFIPLRQVKIFATDLDLEILAKAKKGYYSDKSLKGLPDKYKKKYIVEDGTGIFKVTDEIKSCVEFKQHDLLKDSYPRGMHLIVCRNVMIYFTEEAKDTIYRKFADSLCDEGILFVGSTEQIISPARYQFQGVQSFFYEKQR